MTSLSRRFTNGSHTVADQPLAPTYYHKELDPMRNIPVNDCWMKMTSHIVRAQGYRVCLNANITHFLVEEEQGMVAAPQT